MYLVISDDLQHAVMNAIQKCCHHFEGAHLVKGCIVWRGDQVILHQGTKPTSSGEDIK